MEQHKRKKIVIGISNLWFGGAQKQLLRLLPHFDKEKYEIEIISLMSKEGMDNLHKEFARIVPVHEFSFSGFFDFKNYSALSRKLRELNPDLIVTSLFFANTVFRLINIFHSFPVISREHNTYTDRTKIERFIDRFLSRQTEKIVAVSEEVAEYESRESCIKREKFMVIENGIDLSEINAAREGIDRTALRGELGLHDDELVFLYVGRLVIQKNVDVIIRGFAAFYREHKKSKLVLVGDSIIIDDLKKLAQDEGVADKVVFMGHQDDVHNYYVAADVFVSASGREGMSNTQLEALAHGLPLLTTKTGGTAALLRDGENGFLIDAATPKGVAAAMQKVAALDSAERSALGAIARKHVLYFDILRTAKRYEALFDEVVSRYA